MLVNGLYAPAGQFFPPPQPGHDNTSCPYALKINSPFSVTSPVPPSILVWEGTKLALELGNDVNATDPDGNTALHAAVRLAYSTVVQLLVEHGGKLDIENEAGRTAQDLMCHDAPGRLVRRVGSACPDSAR